MNRHPKDFIEGWAKDLADAFHQAERKYQRSLDRGTPRERALRQILISFLPKRYGVTAGHVVSSTPSWSRQSDVIIYNSLEAPLFSTDTDFQGSVLPAESVFGVVEIKSSLDLAAFRDAAEKIAEFKRLCAGVLDPPLADRFGSIFAFRHAAQSPEDRAKCIAECIEVANSYDETERVDDIFVLGLKDDLGDGVYVARVPQGSPTGPLGYSTVLAGLKNLKIYLLALDSRLRRIRTGVPPDMLSYLFDSASEITHRTEADPRAQRAIGAAPVSPELVQQRIIPKIGPARCPMCQGNAFSSYTDVYCLVATKDYYFGRLAAPRIPLVVLECLGCRWLALYPANAYDITIPG